MLAPLIRLPQRSEHRRNGLRNQDSRSKDLRNKNLRNRDPRHSERGVTLALVALSIVGLIAMASLSIDIGSFYQAKAEAQRTADAAALTAAREISISGMTGDPTNSAASWQPACGGPTSAATVAAIAIAQVSQNFVGGFTPNTITVNYGPGGATPDCSTLTGTTFVANPTVTVTIKSQPLAIFFGRIFGLMGSSYANTTVSGTATAEVYNPSQSVALTGAMIPVQPRCVKPWIVPNSDPDHPTKAFVNPDGSIVSQGIFLTNAGVIGERLDLISNCTGTGATCTPKSLAPTGYVLGAYNYLPYFAGLISATSPATPSCATLNNYQEAIAGCDETTVYQCGVPKATATPQNEVDFSVDPYGPAADTATAAECLTHASAAGLGNGQDSLNPAAYPFQITAGSSNAQNIVGLISSSDSIVSLPIYDNGVPLLPAPPQQPVTIMGFLQVFINQVNTDASGSLDVTVMNVAGCGNAVLDGTATIQGTSPVPIRLITPP
jgi:Flp pilus assembly protein TadG